MGGGGKVASGPHQSYWDSPSLRDAGVDAPLRRSLGEGSTPVTQVAAWPGLLLKRDDCNPTGSHKDRAAAFQVARAAQLACPGVVISSSGNAGIATSRYAELHSLPAFICVHPDTDPDKLAAIDGASTTLIVTPRAINTAKLLARELRMPNLRPSTNDDAIIGYGSLGDELAELACDHVVLFATSGATAAAVAQISFDRHGDARNVHFVQGEGNDALVHPDAVITDRSAHGAAAGRLGVRRSRRARELARAIAATGGRGHVVSAVEVAAAQQELAAWQVSVSEESAANLVVAQRLLRAEPDSVVACVISGAPPAPRGVAHARRIMAVDEHEALAAVRSILDAPLGSPVV
jgi:threonine synthase